MNNLCKISLVTLIALFISCSKHTPEPLFENLYVYKNTLPNSISIDFYRMNAVKISVNIIDSMIIPSNHNRFNYTFAPELNDSIVIKFYDGKKLFSKMNPIHPIEM